MDGTGRLFKEFDESLPRDFETVAVDYATERVLSYKDLRSFVSSSCPTAKPFAVIAE
jgi:hypothetical protein